MTKLRIVIQRWALNATVIILSKSESNYECTLIVWMLHYLSAPGAPYRSSSGFGNLEQLPKSQVLLPHPCPADEQNSAILGRRLGTVHGIVP